jgi:hypothetical protein
MKPTREQVLQWARDAGIGWLERAEGVSEFLERFSTLAYEAGRKDEREWKGLTDEEVMMIYGQNHEGKKYSFGRAIEAKLKEKNT